MKEKANLRRKKLNLPQVSPVAYFKRVQGRHAGDLKVITYQKIMSDGKIYNIDITRMKTSTTMTFGSQGLHLEVSSKEEWDKAYKRLTTYLSATNVLKNSTYGITESN